MKRASFIAPLLIAAILATPIFAIAMTPDEYVNLLQQSRATQGLRTLRTDEINATKTAWKALSDEERLYAEQRVAAILANNGALPVGAKVGLLGTGFDRLTPEDKQTLSDDAEKLAANPLPKNPTVCNSLFSYWSNAVVCVGRTLSAFIGSALITATAWLLQIVGQLFNWLIYYTIVAFGDSTNGFLTQGVQSAINTVWTVFRDFANILIIGLFVFIAISIILGLKEYGAKKLIARALIIAVLINFSLLFTKMIIDGSNFVAYQIYNATKLSGAPNGQIASAASAASEKPTFAQDGIAGQFINFMGVTTVGNTFGTLKDGADAINNGWITLLHGLFSATLLLAAALVLAYGCFLLAARAILMVFLLITSSLAFATYLIPKVSEGNYGWSAWWKALLSNAVFAPLLVLLLYATLQFAKALKPADGTLGALLSDSSNAGNLSALFSYIIILGMLFASFKIASSFSSKIGGFNFAAMIPAVGIAAGARVAAFAGRQAIGRPALRISERMQAASKDETRSNLSRQLFDFGAQRFKGVAKSDFNAMRTVLGGAVAGAAGLKADQLAGAKLGGIVGREEKIAHALAEKARRMTASDSDNKAKRNDIIEKEIANSAQLAAEHAQATQTHTAAKADHATEERNLIQMAQQHDQEMRTLQHELEQTRQMAAEGTRTEGDVQAAQRRVAEARARQATAIDEQTRRIKQARDTVDIAAGYIDRIKDKAEQLAELKGILPSKDDQRTRSAHLAGDMARGRIMNKALLYNNTETERLAHLAEHEVAHQIKKKNLKDSGILDALKEESAHAEPSHGPAAAPAARPPAGGAGGGNHGGGHH